MSAHYDKERGTWQCRYRIKGIDGKPKQKHKRGFKTKREALEYERRKLMSAKGDMSMTFGQFFEDCYTVDKKPTFKPTTWKTKTNIMETHILPVFGNVRMNDITSRHILSWKNGLGDGNKYSNSYLRSIFNCLNSVFSHAVDHYDFSSPMAKVKNFPKGKTKEKNKWELNQYQKFSSVIRDEGDDIGLIIFDMLYFSGLRISELLALTSEDFDKDTKTLRVSKGYHVINNVEYTLPPKTLSSDRVVPIPESLAIDLDEYISRLPYLPEDARLFPFTRSFVRYRLKKYANKAGLEPIKIHEFRHSYVSLLWHLGYTAVEISRMVGHSNPRMVYTYSHPYWNLQLEMVQKLDGVRKEIHSI